MYTISEWIKKYFLPVSNIVFLIISNLMWEKTIWISWEFFLLYLHHRNYDLDINMNSDNHQNGIESGVYTIRENFFWWQLKPSFSKYISPIYLCEWRRSTVTTKAYVLPRCLELLYPHLKCMIRSTRIDLWPTKIYGLKFWRKGRLLPNSYVAEK